MLYIIKNDKPNLFERSFKIVNFNKNIISVPITEKTKERQIEKIAKKVKKVALKNSMSKKIILSKKIKEEDIFVNYLNTYGLEIQDGRWLFKILIPQTVEYIIKKRKLEKINISIMVNDISDIEYENIKILALKYKNLNIVTNHIERFKKIEEDLYNEGISIIISNNKKKSLIKSDIILNIDFSEDTINSFNLKDDAILINVRGKVKINKKKFNGININDYEITFFNFELLNENIEEQFYNKDIYEGYTYKKQNILNIVKDIKKDNVKIKYLISNNGKI